MYILEYEVYILIHACSAGAEPMFILLVKLDGPSHGHISPSYYTISRRAHTIQPLSASSILKVITEVLPLAGSWLLRSRSSSVIVESLVLRLTTPRQTLQCVRC